MGIDMWFRFSIVSIVIAIEENAVVVHFHGQCLDGYLEWYFTVSHPL